MKKIKNLFIRIFTKEIFNINIKWYQEVNIRGIA